MVGAVKSTVETLGSDMNLDAFEQQFHEKITPVRESMQDTTSAVREDADAAIAATEKYLADVSPRLSSDAQDAFNDAHQQLISAKTKYENIFSVAYVSQVIENGDTVETMKKQATDKISSILSDMQFGKTKEEIAEKIDDLEKRLIEKQQTLGAEGSEVYSEIMPKIDTTKQAFNKTFHETYAVVIAGIHATYRKIRPSASGDMQELRKEVYTERVSFYDVEGELEQTGKQASIETVFAQTGESLDITALHVEVAATDQNTLSYWLDKTKNYEDISITALSEGSPEEKILAEVLLQTFAHNIIGEVIDEERRAVSPEWEDNGFDTKAIKKGLNSKLRNFGGLSPVGLDASEQQLYTLIASDTKLGKSLKREFNHVKKAEMDGMIGLMESWNECLGLPPEEKEVVIAEAKKVGEDIKKAMTGGGEKVKEFFSPLFDGKLDMQDAKVAGIIAISAYGISKLVGVIKGWFSQEENKDKKGGSFWKWMLGIGLGGAAAYGLFTYRDELFSKKGKNGKVDTTLPGTVPQDYEAQDYIEAVPQQEQKYATQAAESINTLYAAETDEFGKSSFEKIDGDPEAIGMMFGVLQARYKNVGELLSTDSYYEELLGANLQKFWQNIKFLPISCIHRMAKLLGGDDDPTFVSHMKKGFIDKAVDRLEETLGGREDKKALIEQVFRKSTNLATGLRYKRRQYEEYLAEQVLHREHGKQRGNYTEDEKMYHIGYFLDNEVKYEKHLAADMAAFNSKAIIDIGDGHGTKPSVLETLAKADLLSSNVSVFHKDALDEANEEYNDIIEHNSKTKKSLLDSEGAFDAGGINAIGKERFSKVITNVAEHVKGQGASVFARYMPAVTLLSLGDDTNEELRTMYQQTMGPLLQSMEKHKEKIQNGTFTKDDFKSLEANVQMYREYQKQLRMSSYAVTEIKKEGGKFVAVMSNYIGFGKQVGASLTEVAGKLGGHKLNTLPVLNWVIPDEFAEKMEMHKLKGKSPVEFGKLALQFTGTALSLELLVYPLRVVTGVVKGRLYTPPPKIIRYPVKGLLKLMGHTAEYFGMKIGTRALPSVFYRGNPDMFRYDMVKSGKKIEDVIKIAKRAGLKNGDKWVVPKNSGATPRQEARAMIKFLIQGDQYIDQKQLDVLVDIWDNKSLRKAFLRKAWNGYTMEFRNIIRDKHSYRVVNVEKLTALTEIFDTITDPAERNVLVQLIGDDIAKAKKIAAQMPQLRKYFTFTNTQGRNLQLLDMLTPDELSKALLMYGDDMEDVLKWMQTYFKTVPVPAGSEAKVASNIFSLYRTSLHGKTIASIDNGLLLGTLGRNVSTANTPVSSNTSSTGPRGSGSNPGGPSGNAGPESPYANTAGPRGNPVRTGGGNINQPSGGLPQNAGKGTLVLEAPRPGVTNPKVQIDIPPMVEERIAMLPDIEEAVRQSTHLSTQPHETRQFANAVSEIAQAAPEEVPSKLSQMLARGGKYAGHALRIAGIVGVVFEGVEAHNTYIKADEVQRINQEKADLLNNKANRLTASAVVGGAVVGAELAAITGLMAIPGVNVVVAVVGGVLLIRHIVSSAYYETMDKYTTNFEELKTQAKYDIRMHIVSVAAGNGDIDESRSESFTEFCEGKIKLDELGGKTIEGAIKALLYVDVAYKYKLVEYFDMTDTELHALHKQKTNPESPFYDTLFMSRYRHPEDFIKAIDLEHTAIFMDINPKYRILEKELGTREVQERITDYDNSTYDTESTMYTYGYKTVTSNVLNIEGNKAFKKALAEGRGLAYLDTLISSVSEGQPKIEVSKDFISVPEGSDGLPSKGDFIELGPEWFETNKKVPFVNPIKAALHDIATNVYDARIPYDNRALAGIFSRATSEDTKGIYIEGEELNINAKGSTGLHKWVLRNGGAMTPVAGFTGLLNSIGRDDDHDIEGAGITEIDAVIASIKDAAYLDRSIVNQGSGDNLLIKELTPQYITAFEEQKKILSMDKQSFVKELYILGEQQGGEWFQPPVERMVTAMKLGFTDVGRAAYKWVDGDIMTWTPDGTVKMLSEIEREIFGDGRNLQIA